MRYREAKDLVGELAVVAVLATVAGVFFGVGFWAAFKLVVGA